MATWRTFVYEKLTALKLDYDDSNTILNQLIYYSTLAVNTVMLQHLQKNEVNAYLELFDVNVTLNEDKGWYEFELPQGIFDLDKDYGIKFITFNRKEKGNWLCTPFTWINYDELWRVRKSPHEKPTPTNPFFTRVKNYVHLIGIEAITVQTVTCGLYVTVPVDAVIDLNEEIPLDEAHLYFASQMVDTLLKWALVVTPDKYNDGSDLSEKFNQLSNMFKASAQNNQEEGQQVERNQQYENR